jgi:predicted phage terminase large subunit-like protein
MLSKEQTKELDILLYSREIDKAQNNLIDFTKSTLEGFETEDFHLKYYTLLDAFAKGRIKRLIITMPPQHGKSEGSSRRLPAYMFGLHPNKKIAIASYNTTFASKFNRDIQRIIDTPKYNDIFPETTLNASNSATIASNYLRNSLEFEIVNKLGGLKSVGRGGALTGNKVDVMIMDDLYKDYMEGNSPLIRENVWDWYTSVVSTRLHNNSQELIVFTRWHEDDLIGRLETMGKVKTLESLTDIDTIKLKNDEWFKVNFEALKTSDKTPLDTRPKQTALWESMHSRESLLNSLEMDSEKFECLYQGNPQSQEGLMYKPFKTYDSLPTLKIIKNYTDTADSGTDKLCSIVYGVPLATSDKHIYIIDILYTAKPMEFTEKETIDLINKNRVKVTLIESNNGGRSFARVIKEGVSSNVNWFHQSKNKEARIFSNSATVNTRVVFPAAWKLEHNDFYNDLTKYKKMFKANKHDDAPDVLTGIIEQEDITKSRYDLR